MTQHSDEPTDLEVEPDVFATKRRSENAVAGWAAEGGAIAEGPALDPEAAEAFPPEDA